MSAQPYVAPTLRLVRPADMTAAERAVADSLRRNVFLRALHPDGHRDLRALKKGAEPFAITLSAEHLGSVDDLVEKLTGANLYVGVATRDRESRRSLLDLYALFVDIDFKDFPSADEARAQLAAFSLRPSFVVQTGGGLHAYWLLKEPIDLRSDRGRARQILRTLAKVVGADWASAEPAHILRLPGTLNHKYDPARPVALEHSEPGQRYALEDVLVALPANTEEPTPSAKAPVSHGLSAKERQRQARRWLEHQVPAVEGQSGDKTTYTVACAVAVGFDLSEDDALAALADWNARCSPPWKVPELHVKVLNALDYAEEPRGGRLVTPRLPVEDLSAFLARLGGQEETVWLAPGLVPVEGTFMWHGQPRDFKSLSAQELALALASGRTPFACERFRVERAVKVAFFTEEDPARLFAWRMQRLTAKSGTPAEGMFFPFIRHGLSFDNRDDQEAIITTLQDCGAQVAIFDPLRSFTMHADKGPAELAPVTKFLRRIQNETAAKAIGLIHHDTKPLAIGVANPERTRSQQASGGGIFSISDCPVGFKKLGWNRAVAFPEDYKLSGDPKPFETVFTSNDSVDANGAHRFGDWILPVASTKEEGAMAESVLAARVLKFLKEDKEKKVVYTADDIRKVLQVQRKEVDTVIENMERHGAVRPATEQERAEAKRHANAKLWALAEQEAENGAIDF